MPCLLNFWPWLRTRGAGRDDERRLAAGAEFGVHRGDDDVDVGDAAVGGPGLGAVEDPLVGGLVVAGAGADRADVGAGARARRRRTRASLGSSTVPNICGSHSPICSGVPPPASEAAASPVPRMDSAMPASPQNSSSKTTSMPRPVGSADWSAKKSSEYRPILAASWMIGHGVSSRSSHSAAAGRITSVANSCTQSRMWTRSGDSSKEKDMNRGPSQYRSAFSDQRIPYCGVS